MGNCNGSFKYFKYFKWMTAVYSSIFSLISEGGDFPGVAPLWEFVC